MPGGRLHKDRKLKDTKRFDPNLRDEGAGFFSTLFTAGSNIGSDALTELGYIAQAVSRPIDTGEAVLRVMAGYAQKALPDDWEKYLPEDWATNKVYANAINDYYAEKYGSLEQAADSFAEQPVSVALDAFAVKALLTTVSKQAAKRSIATTKMADTAKGTVMEGELASRAAAELKVAQELERTVKHEGKLVWDDALGAYVPESSVVKPKIAAAEVAPIIDDIEAAAPNNNPAVANVADDTGTTSAAQLARTEEIAYTSNQINRLDNEAVNRGGLTPAEEAAYLQYWRTLEELTEGGIYDDASKAAVGLDADGMMAATRTQEVAPALADDAARISDEAFAEDYRKYIEERANQPLDDFEGVGAYITEDYPSPTGGTEFGASLAKQRADKQRMADDDIMAAATQADLFENGSAAAYEAMMASKLANRAAQTSAVATTVPKGMMAVSPETKLAKLSSVESRIKDRTPVKKQEFAPVSPPKIQTETVIKPANVLPAAQRLAAAASQTQLTGNRGADGSLLTDNEAQDIPILGNDVVTSPPLSVEPKYKDMPPYEKSIDNRDISGGKDKTNTKPGWFQGSSVEGTDDGNYWSADFEDEHWNTPAGVQEAIGIWGRPIGNKIGNPIKWSWN